jgi:hypothetical protein
MGSRQGGRGGNHTNGHAQNSTPSGRGQPIYSEAGKVIGWLRGGVLVKRVSSARGHMLKRPPGWALDSCSLEQVEAKAGHSIELTDDATGLVYRAGVEAFRRWGVTVRRGYGEQICLPLAYWSIDGQPPTAKAARPPEPGEPAESAAQLTLWAS